MENNETELLIDKKVAEAKLEVAEKRLQFVMWVGGVVLAVFGVFIPFWMSNKASDKVDTALNQMRQELSATSQGLRADSRASTESLDKGVSVVRADIRAELDGQARQLGSTAARVDNSIQDMQRQFKELAGAQLRKPALEFLLDGTSLEGKLLKFSPNHKRVTMTIKNTGDATARNLKIHLYSSFAKDCQMSSWTTLTVSDEPAYKCGYVYYEVVHDAINPKESRTFDIDLELELANGNVQFGTYPALLKATYEQSEPRKYSFTMNIADK
jgi:type II secretory pathway component PulM